MPATASAPLSASSYLKRAQQDLQPTGFGLRHPRLGSWGAGRLPEARSGLERQQRPG